MNSSEFFGRAIDLVEAAQIDYMVAGSFASSYYGELRTTRDLDVVVELTPLAVERLFQHLDEHTWYADHDVVLTAMLERRMANVIEIRSGWKLDLVVRQDRPFSVAEFARRRSVDLLGRRAFIASPEDVLLAKLEWAALGGSQRQLDDARSIVRVQGSRLNRSYLDRWAAELLVEAMLADVLGATS